MDTAKNNRHLAGFFITINKGQNKVKKTHLRVYIKIRRSASTNANLRIFFDIYPNLGKISKNICFFKLIS